MRMDMQIHELLREMREVRGVGLREFRRQASAVGFHVRSPQTWADVESGQTQHIKVWHINAYIRTLDLTHEERDRIARVSGLLPRHPAPTAGVTAA